MARETPSLTVVVTAYNEEENLKRGVLEEVYAFINEKKFSWEVIVSDDGSTDVSGNIINIIFGFGNFNPWILGVELGLD